MFVYSGEDTYESYAAAKAAILSISQDAGSPYTIINDDEIISLNEFLYKIESIDIFSASSIILAKRIFNNKDIVNYFIENIESLKNKDLIIWMDKPLDKKTKLYKILNEYNLLKIFELPKNIDLKKWILQKSKSLNITLTEDLVNFIIENVSNDKWIIESELNKLDLLEIKNPSPNDIKEILGLTVKGDIWKFIDFVGNRNKKNALSEFLKITSYEDNCQLIISLLQREFRIMSQIIIGGETSATKLGIPPFIVSKTLAKARNFKKSEIKTFITRLFNLDYAIKKGEIDDKIGLTLLLLTL